MLRVERRASKRRASIDVLFGRQLCELIGGQALLRRHVLYVSLVITQEFFSLVLWGRIIDALVLFSRLVERRP